jgi:hypothetical protein
MRSQAAGHLLIRDLVVAFARAATTSRRSLRAATSSSSTS